MLSFSVRRSLALRIQNTGRYQNLEGRYFYRLWARGYLATCKNLSGSVFLKEAIPGQDKREAFLVDHGRKPEDNVTLRVELVMLFRILPKYADSQNGAHSARASRVGRLVGQIMG
jgi:hypothetical protein